MNLKLRFCYFDTEFPGIALPRGGSKKTNKIQMNVFM